MHTPSQGHYHRSLGVLELTLLGVGVAIGSGIFVLTGNTAAIHAGPAVVLSFVFAGIGACLGALCYAEMASMLPVAGSAYAYARAALGELPGFIIGWDLMLEYSLGAATVAVGWSGYVTAFVRNVFGWELPTRWSQAPFAWDHATGQLVRTDAVLNAPAVAIILVLASLLVRGARESARVNTVLVLLKSAVILTFVVVCARHIEPANWTPFVPPNTGVSGEFGWSGVMRGASVVFFAYLGIDNLTTAALETRDPQRTLPRAIFLSLAVCTVFYVAVCLVLTGVVHYDALQVPHPIAVAAQHLGMPWLETVVEVGAITGLTSVLLVQLYGQPRIFQAMAQDGLMPAFAARLHPRFGTPHVTTLITGAVCAMAAGVFPIGVLSEMCSIGTLLAFIMVSAGVLVLRKTQPDLPRRFRVPFGPVLPVLSIAACVILMQSATALTLWRLVTWLGLGLVIYFASAAGRKGRASNTMSHMLAANSRVHGA